MPSVFMMMSKIESELVQVQNARLFFLSQHYDGSLSACSGYGRVM
jgi:hypothetical protein